MLIFRMLIPSEDQKAVHKKYFYNALIIRTLDITIHFHTQNKSDKTWGHLIPDYYSVECLNLQHKRRPF